MKTEHEMKIFSVFLEKAKDYNWKTSDGVNFSYENDYMTFRISSYNLALTYKETDVNNGIEDSGHEFSIRDNLYLNQLYVDLCKKSREKAFKNIANSDASIKREVGIDEILS